MQVPGSGALFGFHSCKITDGRCLVEVVVKVGVVVRVEKVKPC